MKNQTDPTPSDSVAETDLLKSLDHLEKVAKAQITGQLAGKTDKGTWPKGEEPVEPADADSDVSGDSGEEERDGKKSDTDYRPKNSYRKGVGKGNLRKAEGEDDDAPPADDEDEGGDADEGEGDDREPEVDKSFAASTRGSKNIRDGVEVSPFLRDLVASIGKSLASMERRLRHDFGRQLARSFRAQGEFNKGLAGSLSRLGAATVEQGDLIKAIAAQPARGLKSQTHAARPIQKSFDAGGEDGGETLSRDVVMQRLMNGVAKGLVSAGEVVKFESTGIIHPALYKAITSDERFAK